MESEIQRLLSLLKSTYEKNAGYGPSVKEVLKDITVDEAAYRINNTHSIIELVSHMTAWRNFVIKKLEGDVEYKVKKALNFSALANWITVLQELEESQVKLISAIQKFDFNHLHQLVPHSPSGYTFFTLLHGIIQHDIYHIGQIMLLKKSK